MIKMEKCPHCEKSMPRHILVKHLNKTHGLITETDINGKVVTSTGKAEENNKYVFGESIVALGPTTLAPELRKWYEKWDAGEIGVCAQCKSELPSKLMGFHLKMEHGL